MGGELKMTVTRLGEERSGTGDALHYFGDSGHVSHERIVAVPIGDVDEFTVSSSYAAVRNARHRLDMSMCIAIVWIVTCVRKKADPSSSPPNALTPKLSPIISLPEMFNFLYDPEDVEEAIFSRSSLRRVFNPSESQSSALVFPTAEDHCTPSPSHICPETCLSLSLTSLLVNPAFPFADSTRGSETDVEPVITGGDLSLKGPSPLQRKSPKLLPIIEVNTNAIADDKKDDLRSACIFIVKPSSKTFIEKKKEKIKKTPKEETTDKTQSSDRPLQSTDEKTVLTGRSISERSEKKAISKKGKLEVMKNKSAKIVKNIFRIGIKSGSQKSVESFKSKPPSSSESQQLITAKAIVVKRKEKQIEKVEALKANFEAIPMGSGGCVVDKNDTKNEAEMIDKTAKSIERDKVDQTQSPIFTPERTQSTKIMKE